MLYTNKPFKQKLIQFAQKLTKLPFENSDKKCSNFKGTCKRGFRGKEKLMCRNQLVGT